MKIPTSPSEITAEWLGSVLLSGASDSEIVSVKIDENFGRGHLGMLGEVVRVIYHTDQESEPKFVIVKFQKCDDKRREGKIYHLLSEAKAPYVPRLLGEFGNGNLVLEDMSSAYSKVETKEGFTISQARNVISKLADINSRFWGDPRVPKDDILHFINSININMTQGWDIFKNRYRPQLGEEAADFEWMWENREIVSGYYNSGSATLIHGDVNRGNLLFSNDGNDEPVLIDWQLAGHKVLPFDLVYFIVKELTVEQRREHEDELRQLFYGLLPDHVRAGYTFERLILDYRACVTRPMLSAVTMAGPKFDNIQDRWERTDERARRIIAAARDLKPVEAINELQTGSWLDQ